jgi:sec-independent protein translocase protein TatA
MGLDNPIHLAFIVVILLLVFGAKRLPEIGRSLGSGMREFKDSVSGEAKQSTITPAVRHSQEPVQAPVAQPVAPPAAAPTVTPPPVEPQ